MDDNNSVWFTEWTENRIGVLNSSEIGNLPIYLTVPTDTIHLNKSELNPKAIEISVFPNQSQLTENVKMTIAGSISQSGRLWNLTGKFSEDSFSFVNNNSLTKGKPRVISLELTPTSELLDGNYTLTIGARYGAVTYSNVVDLIVS